MTPAEIRKATIGELRAARKAMLSTEWMEQFKLLSEPEQKDSKRLLFEVHHAIHEMENTALADIRDKLVANEKALGEGIDNLKKALKKIEKIGAAIKAIGQFLGIVVRVAKLVAKA